MSTNLQTVPVGDIIKSDMALREVDQETDAFLELVASVRERGILNAISVMETPEGLQLIDGRHRLTAAEVAGLSEIPAIIMTGITESDQLEMQVIANVQRVDTKPAQFGTNLRRLMNNDPLLTTAVLAKKLGKSTQWISKTLTLNRLSEPIAELVDKGDIVLANAYALAALPEEEQANWIDRALNDNSDVFVPECTAKAKDIKDETRRGRSKVEQVFEPNQRLRKLVAIKDELTTSEIASALPKAEAKGFSRAIAWVLHQDSETLEQDRAAWEARRAEQVEAKAKRKAAREAAQAVKNKDKADKALAEIEADAK